MQLFEMSPIPYRTFPHSDGAVQMVYDTEKGSARLEMGPDIRQIAFFEHAVRDLQAVLSEYAMIPSQHPHRSLHIKP